MSSRRAPFTSGRVAGLEVRPFREAELARLQQLLESDAAYFRRADGSAPGPREALSRWSEAEADEGALLLGAFGAKGPLGLLSLALEHPTPDSVAIALLFIAPAARRRGLGRAWTQWLTRQAGEAGFTQLFLGVDDREAAAQALWKGLGFRPLGHASGITEMVRELTPAAR